MLQANFPVGSRNITVYGLTQYDYGQVLEIYGLPLPAVVECQICLQKSGGTTESLAGVTVDNVLTLTLPDTYLAVETDSDYTIYIYVYVTTEHSGTTVYRINLPVSSRPMPEGYEPSETSPFADVVAEVTELMEEAQDAAVLSESWAVGGTGTREGEDTNNSSYYATQAASSASDAHGDAVAAAGYASDAHDDAVAAHGYKNDASGSAEDANTYAGHALNSKNAAAASALVAEGYADGKQNCEAVASGSPYYHNNAKYYSDEADSSATAASGKADEAAASALVSEGYAAGTQGGEAVTSESPYYENNSKYYATQAAASATSAAAASTNLAPTFSTSTAYSAGDYVLYNGTLYRFNSAHAAGAWTGSDATAVKMGPEVSELKSDKADKDGTYSSLTAGNLATEDGANNNTPYLFRASGGGVRVGEREYDKIVGGTVAWNQLIDLDNLPSDSALRSVTTYTSGGVTFTKNSDGSISVVTDENGAVDNPAVKIGNAVRLPTIQTHKHLIRCIGGTANCFINYASTRNVTNESIFNGTTGGFNMWLRVNTGTIISTPIKIYPQVIDLTQMFGTTIADYIYNLETATAGAGIAKLKEWGFFTQPYYPYNAGELKSVEGLTSHEMVGFNQWDEEWEVGAISSGVIRPADNAIRSKNFCKCIGGATYFITCGKTDGGNQNRYYIATVFYDADKTYISTAYNNNGTAIAPENAAYFKVTTNTSTVVYGNTYNHDICINLSDPAKNGTYEPYVKHTYPLDDSLTLRGIPKLDSANSLYYDGDTYESDGTMTRRYGIVDLGTLDWHNNGTDSAYSEISDKKNGSQNIVCDGLVQLPASTAIASMTEKTIKCYSTYNTVAVKVTGINQSNAQTLLSGIYLVYELATATSETAEPFASPQIVDEYGTEEYVTTGIVPVGQKTFYPENLRQKIEGLPWNFASLIAPTEVTYKATQNYTSGALFIVNNILYKATANIANGGNITPGTNCQATTLAAVIAAL